MKIDEILEKIDIENYNKDIEDVRSYIFNMEIGINKLEEDLKNDKIQ